MDMLMNQYWTITLHLQRMTDNDVPRLFMRMNDFFVSLSQLRKQGYESY